MYQIIMLHTLTVLPLTFISLVLGEKPINVYAMYWHVILGFPGGSAGKESTAIQETTVGFLGQEDLLEKG